MRNLLAALSLLVAGVTLYQGLVLRGLIDGPAEPIDADAATFVLIAAGVMALAAVLVRWFAGIAALEMALAGSAVMGIGLAHHPHRYLTAYGSVAVVIALAAMAIELWPSAATSAHRTSRSPARAMKSRRFGHYRPSSARLHRVHARHLPSHWQERVPPWPAARQLRTRIDVARARQAAERRHWRAWCAAHRPSQGRPTVTAAAIERIIPGGLAEVYEQHEGRLGSP